MKFPWLQQAQHQFIQRFLADRQAHALLLNGPAGLGKLQLAGEMAAALLCLQPLPLPEGAGGQAGLACGQCKSCQLFKSGAHPDYRLVSFVQREKSEDLKTVIGVDQVRELISSMQLTTGLSPRKVALIHPAEAMNRNAANALLKTLEEPLGNLVLILVSHDAARLPATVRSRCQNLNIRSPGPGEAESWLRDFTGVSQEEARLALQAAGNSPLQAAAFLQQSRISDYRKLLEQLQLVKQDHEQVATAYAELFKFEPDELWRWLAIASAEQLRVSTCAANTVAPQPPDIAPDAPDRHRRERHWAEMYRLANHNRRLLSTPVRKDLLLRDWLIQWGSPTSS